VFEVTKEKPVLSRRNERQTVFSLIN